MEKGQYGVLIVGYGGMGRWHRDNVMDIPDILELVGVHDIDPARNEEARSHGLQAYDTLDEALTDDSIQIVIVAAPNDVHKDITVRALKAGKHVLCEKPVALNSAELAEMQQTAAECGRVFSVHQNRRFDEDWLTVRKIVEDNELGDIFAVESRVMGSRGIPGDWRNRKKHGGGMVLDWGVHLLDQMLLFWPEAKIKRVYAYLTHVTNGEVDDGFKALLSLDNGVECTVEVGTSCFVPLPRWVVQGANGSAVIDDFFCHGKMVTVKDWKAKDAVPIRTGAGLTKTMAPRTDDSVNELPLPVVRGDIRKFMENFVAAMEGREEILVKPHEVMRVMKLMEAIFESAETGKVVQFE